MERRGDEVHMNETEASGGSKEGVVRWVLVVGLILVIGFLSLIWITGAFTQSEREEEATVAGRMEAAQRDLATDSVVAERVDDIEGAPEGNNSPADDPGRDEK